MRSRLVCWLRRRPNDAGGWITMLIYPLWKCMRAHWCAPLWLYIWMWIDGFGKKAGRKEICQKGIYHSSEHNEKNILMMPLAWTYKPLFISSSRFSLIKLSMRASNKVCYASFLLNISCFKGFMKGKCFAASVFYRVYLPIDEPCISFIPPQCLTIMHNSNRFPIGFHKDFSCIA
jgi:hypothetical protein